MIKSVTITNYLGDSIKIPLNNSNTSGFLITDISGLGPVQADINLSDYATIDGSVFNSARLSTRNIVLQIIFDEYTGSSIEDLRQKSYKYFPIKKDLEFMIETDNRKCKTTGYVETNEPTIFSSQEGCQISIICPDPYFYEANSITAKSTRVEPSFEFPFSNNDASESMLVMGYINHNSDILIDYNGDSSVGAIIQLFFTGDIPQDNSNPDDIRTPLYLKISKSSASLDDASSEMTIKLSDMSPSLKVGDTIIISTIKGNKSIYLYRDNTEYNIINYLDKESDWIQLTNNENYISCYFSDDEDDSVFIPDISLSVSYNISYEGV